MSSPSAIIIGAGLSGLGAAIRLSQYGWNVTVFEQHQLPGGLNSTYVRHGRNFDTGLHAMTNISGAEQKAAPLNVLLRQLRIRRDELELCPQTQSSIVFPQNRLAFTNDIHVLQENIASQFPGQIDGFMGLTKWVEEYNPFEDTSRQLIPVSPMLNRFVSSTLLQDMIRCPVMYYGNANENEMDLRQFCIIFKSMFLEGMGRPKNGMKTLLECLLRRLKENGANLQTGRKICTVESNGKAVTAVLDECGMRHEADWVLSCAGAPETALLLQSGNQKGTQERLTGNMAYIEFLFELDKSPQCLGLKDGIMFRNESSHFRYRAPETPVDFESMVICTPGNFQGVESKDVRVTVQASPIFWHGCANDIYDEMKTKVMQDAVNQLDKYWRGFADSIARKDMYTPKTFTRFTGRINGAIYGSPVKAWDGLTELNNLRLIGADQGYLGIVGALMSGVSIANRLLMTETAR